MKNTIIILVILLVLIIGGYYFFSHGPSQNSYAPAPVPNTPASSPAVSMPYGDSSQNAVSSTPQTPSQNETNVLDTSSNSALGAFIVADNGMTLYKYANDKPGASNCTGQCAAIWPAYTVSSSAPLKGGGAVTGAIATIAKPDGTMQVTYNGSPLYLYSNDTKPGDTNGQGIGGLWSVVKP